MATRIIATRELYRSSTDSDEDTSDLVREVVLGCVDELLVATDGRNGPIRVELTAWV
jgi:hypothetical protein